MGGHVRPRRLSEALELLAGGGAVPAAGCTDLFPATEAPELAPGGMVVDLGGLDELRGIDETAQGWRIGALTTWSEVARAALPPAFDMLRAAAREVGSVQIQNAGTVGGNLCNASPAADGMPPLLALDAGVELASAAGGRRRLALRDFVTGPRRTALAPGELLVAVHVPRAAGRGRSRFRKLGSRRHLVISIVSAAVRLVARAGRAEAVALAVGACSPVPVRLSRAEAMLAGRPLAELAGALDGAAVAAALSPVSDLRAGAGYRREAAVTLLRRMLAELAEGEGTERAGPVGEAER